MWLPNSSASVARPLLRCARYKPRISASASADEAAGDSWMTLTCGSLHGVVGACGGDRDDVPRPQGPAGRRTVPAAALGEDELAAVEPAQQRLGGGGARGQIGRAA